MSETAIPCACVPNVKKKCSPIAGGVRMENSKGPVTKKSNNESFNQ